MPARSGPRRDAATYALAMRTPLIRACVLLLATVAALAQLPASAPGATTGKRPPKCGAASKAGNAKIVDRSRQAVVFRRKQVYYGCVYGSREVRKYQELCCQNVRVDVAGHFMGYTYEGTAIGDESNKLGAFNLRTGTQLKIAKLAPNSEGGGREIDTSAIVPDFLITATGALVWLQAPAGSDQYELRAGDGTPRRERVVDSGMIAPKSLKRGAGGKSVKYTKDGAAATAKLRS